MILALLLSIVPYSPVIESQAETCEINHLYDDNGRHIFDQLIFLDKDSQVMGWRLFKRGTQMPNGGIAVHYDGMARVIRYRVLHETWRQYDPEVEDRRVLPMDQRVGLGFE